MRKLLLFLFLFLCTIESSVFGQYEAIKGVLVRTYPKKYNSLFHRHLSILNRKYSKTAPPPNTKKINKENTEHTYTAFPPLPGQHKKIPESSYFSVASYAEVKPNRVKKVLPDYGWKQMERKKRSVESISIPPKQPKIKYRRSGNVAVLAVSSNTEDPSVLHKFRRKNETKDDKSKVSAKPKTRRNGDSKVKSGNGGNKTRKRLVNGKSKRKSNTKNKKGGQRKQKDDKQTKKRAENRRLIAAEDESIETYPYVVSIQKGGQHWCTGSLLNQRLVITTANCVWKSQQVSLMKVRACSRFTDHGGQVARIQELMKHPDWSIRKQPDFDVALLVLDRFLKFSHTCHGLDLPNRVMHPAFEDAWVSSWGAERRDGIVDHWDRTLQVYHTTVIDRDTCNNVTQRFGVSVSKNFICLSQAGRRAPCTRDTGAPAVSDGVLWGMASWGIRKLCGTERFPAMFSYVASHANMDFIARAQKKMMGEERLYPYPDRYHYVPRTPHEHPTEVNPFAA